MSEKYKVVQLAPTNINDDAVHLIEDVLERLRRGESIAVAVVEVMKAGNVATAYCKSQSYHHLNSGAARLAARLASAED